MDSGLVGSAVVLCKKLRYSFSRASNSNTASITVFLNTFVIALLDDTTRSVMVYYGYDMHVVGNKT